MPRNEPAAKSDVSSVIDPSLGLAAEWVHIDSLIPQEKNPRKNDDAAPKLADVIVRVGFGRPMIGWIEPETGATEILGGHTTRKAVQILQRKLKKLSTKDRLAWHPDAIRVAETGLLPVRIRRDLTQEQARILALADNRANEWSEWDDPLLMAELGELSFEDIEIAGWGQKDLDKLGTEISGIGFGGDDSVGGSHWGAVGEMEDGGVIFHFGAITAKLSDEVHERFKAELPPTGVKEFVERVISNGLDVLRS